MAQKLDPITGQPKQGVYTSDDSLPARLNARMEDRSRLYGQVCECTCGCPVYHRFGDVCALCQHDDHWDVIIEYLNTVTTRP